MLSPPELGVSGPSSRRRKQAEAAGCYLPADVFLPQHKDLGNEGRTSSGSSEHQLNAETLGSMSSNTGEFFVNRIIIKDLRGKKNSLL